MYWVESSDPNFYFESKKRTQYSSVKIANSKHQALRIIDRLPYIPFIIRKFKITRKGRYELKIWDLQCESRYAGLDEYIHAGETGYRVAKRNGILTPESFNDYTNAFKHCIKINL